jgi:hypothetical protein
VNVFDVTQIKYYPILQISELLDALFPNPASFGCGLDG